VLRLTERIWLRAFDTPLKFPSGTSDKYSSKTQQPLTTTETIQMPKHRKPEKKQIDQYDHKEVSRANNPPVGLVTPETDRDTGKKTYAYDLHLDPSLQFDPDHSQIESPKIVEVEE